MPRTIDRAARVADLIQGFPRYVGVFEKSPAFTRIGQLEYHLETIQMRRKHGSAVTAVADDTFLSSLYQTLNAWGIGRRASRLLPEVEFVSAVRARIEDIAELEREVLDAPSLNAERVCDRLWALIEELGITQNNTPIVSCTKALHHILPDLVVPIDRGYTQRFFRWQNPQFQYDQAGAFRFAFHAFVNVARNADPRQYVGAGWNSSLTKVIDNAIVGMVTLEKGVSGR
jgi:hypothetical protein